MCLISKHDLVTLMRCARTNSDQRISTLAADMQAAQPGIIQFVFRDYNVDDTEGEERSMRGLQSNTSDTTVTTSNFSHH